MCSNFANSTLCSKPVLACLRVLLGNFGCLSASWWLPEPLWWQLARIPVYHRLFSFFFPLFTLSHLCNFQPPSHIPALLQPLPQSSSPPKTGSALKAAPWTARTCFSSSTSATEWLGHSKIPAPACSRGLLCILSLLTTEDYKKPFSPRVHRFSPRITHGSLLRDL